MDESSIDERIARTSYIIVVLTFIAGALGVFMAYIAGSYLTKPIRELVKATEEIGNGNLDYKIKMDSDDEIHVLSKAFNEMAYNLNKSISELHNSKERYRKLVDSIGDAVILIDSKKQILSWNRAAEEIFGWSFEEVKNKSIEILFKGDDISGKMVLNFQDC